jgi:hypothetical protein
MSATARIGAAALFVTLAVSAAPAQTTCVGDCNGNNVVTINELILGVNIALGTTNLSQCPAFDPNGDGKVGINELITGVNNALNGCHGGMTGVERTFTIEPGMQNASPAPPNMMPGRNQTRSGLFTNALSNSNAAIEIGPGPLTIVMGTQDANGVASLKLKEDVDLAVQTLVPCLCMHIFANGSDGSIDCNGGTAYDTQAVREANAPGFGWTATTGLGSPSGPGNANLLVMAQFKAVGDATFDCTAAQCATITYTDPPNLFAFTTTTATAIQKQTTGGDLVLSDVGEPFDCANFGTSNSGGMLAAPAPTIIDPFGAFANVFRFAEAFHAQ